MHLTYLLAISIVASMVLIQASNYFPVLYKKLLPGMNLADTVTVVGVVFGVLILFRVEPQFVHIEKVEAIKLGPFVARQWLTSRPGFDDSTLTPFYVRGYVVNNGDIVGMNYAVELSLPRVSYRSGIYRPYSAFVVAGDTPMFPQLSSLDWYQCYPHGSVNVEYAEKWPRVEIPPVKPAGEVGIIVGLAKLCGNNLTNDAMVKFVSTPLTIRLLKLKKSAHYYEVIDTLQIDIDTIKYYDAML
jgi:hypothetical protein